VIEVPNGATVSPSEDGTELKIQTVDDAGWTYSVPPHCGNDIENVRQRHQRQAPETINGWLDNAGWYPPSGQDNLNSFTATYTVPGNPNYTKDGQVLFYFIGMQNNGYPNAVNILQPVLTWGNGYTQWYVKSWACCPSNITVSSPPIFGLNPGSTFFGTINRVSSSTWKIDSIFNGQHTTLNAQVGSYIYNWADVTLEVYNIAQCTDFATGPMTFSALAMTDSKGQTLTPQWQLTAATSCSGRIVKSGASALYIQHN